MLHFSADFLWPGLNHTAYHLLSVPSTPGDLPVLLPQFILMELRDYYPFVQVRRPRLKLSTLLKVTQPGSKDVQIPVILYSRCPGEIFRHCYRLSVCIPSKFMLKLNSQGDGIRRWGLWGMIRGLAPLENQLRKLPGPFHHVRIF